VEQSTAHMGRRLREIRTWRGLSQEAVAGLAGFNKSYISMIESGQKHVDKRSTLEALASALRVAPSELANTSFPAGSPEAEDVERSVAALRLALADAEIGEPVDVPVQPWPEVSARLAQVEPLRSRAEFLELADLLPGLILDLHAHLPGPQRTDALVGLVDCYSGAQSAAKRLGVPDLAQVASRHVRDVAAALSGPQWAGLAAWQRANAIASASRERSLAVAVRGANDIAGHLDDPEVTEVYGALHLVAALATLTLGRADTAADHVAEASEIARRPGITGTFGQLWFGPGNIDIWRTTLAVEAGDGGRAVEIARQVDLTTLPPAPTRRAAWQIEIGRGLAMERKTRREAVEVFKRAEDLSPQQFRTNVFAREAVGDLLGRSLGEEARREVRVMAWRMGIAA
jgi:transcriptional regulator with XRE-family HTH domain